ncbi:MAG: hypothetical protein EA400_07685 [Chromatiaceae bacterium]|nr:MAG: hypothetical protein EA400_07685 [Chromatiaceae bacterium]
MPAGVRRFARAGLTASLLTVLGLAAVPARAANELRFAVYLNERPIGEHQFRITERGDLKQVESTADFRVDFLFLNAYHYRHHSQETFSDGCLQRIRANTNDNGTRYQVSGERRASHFEVERRRQRDQISEQTDGCVMTFAYWNPALLAQERLLNPQTGEFEAVAVQATGTDQVTVGDTSVPANRYALRTSELTIDLWYHDDLGWVKLASEAAPGRRITYRRQ